MTAEQTTQQADEKAVIEWLQQHPDLFLRHPELLDSLQLSHTDSVNTTSLIEHQVGRLRLKNQEMERKMHQMLENGIENEKLMVKIHRLTLDLSGTHNLKDFFQLLLNELQNNFNADHVYIGLFEDKVGEDAEVPVNRLQRDNPELAPFHSLLVANQTSCGRLAREKLQFLFGRDNPVRSTALVPLGSKGEYGMLAIGSENPGRFFPGMGTMFLELLSQAISHRLNISEAAPQRLIA